jgi:hypothetical protein
MQRQKRSTGSERGCLMFCEKCGAELVPPGKFCVGCGKRLKRLWGKWLLLGAVGYIGIIFLVSLIPSDDGLLVAEPPPRSEPQQRLDLAKTPWLPQAKVFVNDICACVPNPSDFHLLAKAVIGADTAALRSLELQGKVFILDAGTRAEVIASGLAGSRTNIQVQSGDYSGQSCDLLTAQLGAR